MEGDVPSHNHQICHRKHRVNRPISQIPQCIKYPTMHHFVTEMCTRVVHCEIWDWCIVGCVWQVKSRVIHFNTSRPEQNGQHYQNHVLEWKFFKILLYFFVPKGKIDKLSLGQIMSRHWTGDKPLTEPMMTQFTSHFYICIARPCWVKDSVQGDYISNLFASKIT